MTATATEFTPNGWGCGPGPHAHTPKEAAALFGLDSENTLLRLAYARRIEHTAICRKIRFTDEQLVKALATLTQLPTSQTHPTPSARTRRTA